MTFSEFQQLVNVSKHDIYRDAFAQNRKSIRVKKEMTAVKNLARIFDATLHISNRKGFRAMSMRDLSNETGLSMGALYAYFSSKDELLEMLQRQGRTVTRRILEECIESEENTLNKLRTAIRTHLYVSEAMQPWFFFSYMETKNLAKKEGKKAIASELYTEKVFSDIISQGQEEGIFLPRDHQLTAGVIKAMLQDWYLKRWKYDTRNVSVDQYARFVLGFVEAYCLAPKYKDTGV